MLDFDGSYAMAKQFVKVRRIVSRGSFALVVGILAVTTAALASAAPGASTVPPVYAAAPAEVNPPASPAAPGTPAAPAAPGQAEEVAPIPPEVEEAPVAATSGGYCFAGPHPADTRVAAGPAWDETQSNHIHNYPPFDLRLFRLQNGCYPEPPEVVGHVAGPVGDAGHLQDVAVVGGVGADDVPHQESADHHDVGRREGAPPRRDDRVACGGRRAGRDATGRRVR